LGVHHSIASLNHVEVLSFRALGEVAEGLSSVIIVVGGLMDPTGSNMKGFNNKGGKRCTTLLTDDVIAEMSLRPPRAHCSLKAPEVQTVGGRLLMLSRMLLRLEASKSRWTRIQTCSICHNFLRLQWHCCNSCWLPYLIRARPLKSSGR
jgi:hypothetical protein